MVKIQGVPERSNHILRVFALFKVGQDLPKAYKNGSAIVNSKISKTLTLWSEFKKIEVIHSTSKACV